MEFDWQTEKDAVVGSYYLTVDGKVINDVVATEAFHVNDYGDGDFDAQAEMDYENEQNYADDFVSLDQAKEWVISEYKRLHNITDEPDNIFTTDWE